jgi:hypothetical protein
MTATARAMSGFPPASGGVGTVDMARGRGTLLEDEPLRVSNEHERE